MLVGGICGLEIRICYLKTKWATFSIEISFSPNARTLSNELLRVTWVTELISFEYLDNRSLM